MDFEYSLEPLHKNLQNQTIAVLDCPPINRLAPAKPMVEHTLKNIERRNMVAWLVSQEKPMGTIGLRLSPAGFLRTSIYLHTNFQGKGHFGPLYSWLWQASQSTIHPMQISIAKDNLRSLKAHQNLWPDLSVVLENETFEQTGIQRLSWVFYPDQSPKTKQVGFDLKAARHGFYNSKVWSI